MGKPRMLVNLLAPKKCLASVESTPSFVQNEYVVLHRYRALLMLMVQGTDATCRVFEDNLLCGWALSLDSTCKPFWREFVPAFMATSTLTDFDVTFSWIDRRLNVGMAKQGFHSSKFRQHLASALLGSAQQTGFLYRDELGSSVRE
jgi:hypothetical protein